MSEKHLCFLEIVDDLLHDTQHIEAYFAIKDNGTVVHAISRLTDIETKNHMCHNHSDLLFHWGGHRVAVWFD